MSSIQSYRFSAPTPFNKSVATLILVTSISGIAAAIIGWNAAPRGPFSALVQLDEKTKQFLLGTSCAAFALDQVWISVLFQELAQEKKGSEKKETPSGLERQNETSSSCPGKIVFSSCSFNETINLPNPLRDIDRKTRVSALVANDELCKKNGVDWARNSKLWNEIDLSQKFPRVNFFDRTMWERCFDMNSLGLSFDDLPPLDKRSAYHTLKSASDNFSIFSYCTRLTILTIPKGLSIKKLVEAIQSSKMPQKVNFDLQIDEAILGQERSVNKPYHLLISKKASNLNSSSNFKDKVHHLEKKGYCYPSALEMVLHLTVLLGVYNDNVGYTYEFRNEISSNLVKIGNRSENTITVKSVGQSFWVCEEVIAAKDIS